MKTNWIKWLLRILAVGAVALAVSQYIRLSSEPIHSNEQLAKTVAVVTVKREDLARNINLTAELRPYQEIDLHAKVTGYVKAINVDIGDQVKAGQVLATLDIAEQQADFAKAEATYREAKLDHERIQGVVRKKPGLLAQDEVDKARATYEVAEANRARAKAFTDYSIIRAPFAGKITKRSADKGALVQAGTSSNTQPMLHLSDNTKLRLVFPVPESIVPQISVGMPVQVSVQVTNETFQSKITRVSGMIDSATRTMEVEVDLDNPDLKLTPGMYATVQLDLNTKSGVLTVPVQAISGKDKMTVWVINADQKTEERLVKVGLQTSEKVEIESGVNEGELVVFGSRNVALGTKVNPKVIEGKKP